MTAHAHGQETHGTAQRGQSLTEFAFILTLIAIVAILALVFLDDALADLLSLIGEGVE